MGAAWSDTTLSCWSLMSTQQGYGPKAWRDVRGLPPAPAEELSTPARPPRPLPAPGCGHRGGPTFSQAAGTSPEPKCYGALPARLSALGLPPRRSTPALRRWAQPPSATRNNAPPPQQPPEGGRRRKCPATLRTAHSATPVEAPTRSLQPQLPWLPRQHRAIRAVHRPSSARTLRLPPSRQPSHRRATCCPSTQRNSRWHRQHPSDRRRSASARKQDRLRAESQLPTVCGADPAHGPSCEPQPCTQQNGPSAPQRNSQRPTLPDPVPRGHRSKRECPANVPLPALSKKETGVRASPAGRRRRAAPGRQQWSGSSALTGPRWHPRKPARTPKQTALYTLASASSSVKT